VAEAVGEDEPVFSNQRRNGADIRQIAGCEGECGFSVIEPGECRFEFFVGRKGAADETRGPGSRPVLTRRFDGRFYDGWVGGQAQVIIGGKQDHGVPVEPDRRPRGGGDGAQPTE
jgi:hypothetical protein